MIDVEDLKEQIRENFDIPVEEQEEKVFEEYVRLTEKSIAFRDYRLDSISKALRNATSYITNLMYYSYSTEKVNEILYEMFINFVSILITEDSIRDALEDGYICSEVDEDGFRFIHLHHIYDYDVDD